MKNAIALLFFWFQLFSFSQTDTPALNKYHFFGAGFSLGKTFDANTGFPETKLFTDVELTLGNWQFNNKEWAYRLKYPRTGLSFSFSEFGNNAAIGNAYSLTSFIEFEFFRNKRNQLFWRLGAGFGYFNRQFDIIDNPLNKAITTKLNISFKTSVYYELLRSPDLNLRAGVSLIHYSNGHSKLPNQGLNTLAFQVSSQFSNSASAKSDDHREIIKNKFEPSKQLYYSIRYGAGQNVLSRVFNSKKEIHTLSMGIGKIVNKTFKMGIGAHYRFYRHYYDYIRNNEALVQDRFSNFREHPFRYASNFGVYASGELLMGHIGAEFDIGFNFYKPAYKIDWILNDGFTYTTGGDNPELVVVHGELNDYFRLKRAIPTRLGLKFYAINNRNLPKNNLYLAAHINANLGQADFTELSLGYVHRFEFKRNPKKQF